MNNTKLNVSIYLSKKETPVTIIKPSLKSKRNVFPLWRQKQGTLEESTYIDWLGPASQAPQIWGKAKVTFSQNRPINNWAEIRSASINKPLPPCSTAAHNWVSMTQLPLYNPSCTIIAFHVKPKSAQSQSEISQNQGTADSHVTSQAGLTQQEQHRNCLRQRMGRVCGTNEQTDWQCGDWSQRIP